jgi:EAL domain-containing protein (putative c-di-GMP-specific phosphodiesterase class I)
MSQTVIEALNGKMQDAFLDDFTQHLNVDKFGRYTGLYRGFTLDSVFQPITSGNDQHTIGYEALLRPSIGTALPVEPKFVFAILMRQAVWYSSIESAALCICSIFLPSSRSRTYCLSTCIRPY